MLDDIERADDVFSVLCAAGTAKLSLVVNLLRCVFIGHKQARKMNYEAAVRDEMAVLVCDRCYADVVELYAVTVCVQDRRCTCRSNCDYSKRRHDDSTCDNCDQVACPKHEMSWVRLKNKKR